MDEIKLTHDVVPFCPDDLGMEDEMFGLFKKQVATKETVGGGALSALVAARGLKLGGQPPNTPDEVAAIAAVFLINEMMARSSINFSQSNENRRLTIGLLSLVVCDCASRIARVRFELVALMVFKSLYGNQLGQENLGNFLKNSIRVFNGASDGATKNSPIAQFGQSVMGFFQSNNESMLEGISEVFPLMVGIAE